ncbi:MAG: LTA synthase family protein, partial [Rikenellaceae bacterium]
MKKINILFGGNSFYALIARFVLILIFSMIVRFEYYFINYSMFSSIGLSQWGNIILGGLRFDIAAAIYFNIPIIIMQALPFQFVYGKIYKRCTLALYLILNSILLLTNFLDSVYFKYTLRRSTFSVLEEFKSDKGAYKAIFESMLLYPWVTAAAIITIITFIIFALKIKVKGVKQKNKTVAFILNTIALALCVGLAIGGMRGGFAHSTRPITLSNASQYVNVPLHRELVLNTPFSLLRTIKVPKIEVRNYFNNKEEEKFFTALQKPDTTKSPYNFGTKPNIVLLIMESFGSQHIGAYNKDKEGRNKFTPFLDSLASESATFLSSYANGLKSIDALPSTLVSIPSLVVPFVLSENSGNELYSLANIVKKEGYTTSFFHGAPRGSMGLLAFCKQVGVDNYYGMEDFGDDSFFDGMWGIWDEEFLLYQAKMLSTMPQPFLAATFSVSSHHPFKIPARYEGQFKEGDEPLQKCITYSDMALRKFFEAAKKEDWYKNTIFIITADHPNQSYTEEYLTADGSYKVPMIIHSTIDNTLKFTDTTTVVQQCDILPTIAYMISNKEPLIAFGN